LGFILSSSFFQLGLFVFVLSISRLELNLNLINLISRLGNNKTDGGGVQDEEDGIREYGIIPCFAGWVAWLGIHTSLLLWDFSGLVLAWSAGQPASETQRVAGSYTASGWTCLACIRSLLTGTLGSLARLNLARHGTARWQWALFPWSFLGGILAWWMLWLVWSGSVRIRLGSREAAPCADGLLLAVSVVSCWDWLTGMLTLALWLVGVVMVLFPFSLLERF
jgi:hypothetical protein